MIWMHIWELKFTVNNPQRYVCFGKEQSKTSIKPCQKTLSYAIRCIFISSFPKVKTAAFYLISIKNNSKHTHRPFSDLTINVTSTYHNKTALIEILLLRYQLKNNEMSQKNIALFLLLFHIKRKFPRAFYMEIKYFRHYF